MSDPHYPSIDYEFLVDQISNSAKVIPDSMFKVGDTTTFVLRGSQALHKRLILIREFEDGQICFEQASGLALRLHFIGPLLTWLEQNKNWKDGGYFVND